MNTCATCKHWKPIDTGSYRTTNRGGECVITVTADSDKPYFASKALAIVRHPDPGSGVLWTLPDFGCVQHNADVDRLVR
jgi:hypothetical protein